MTKAAEERRAKSEGEVEKGERGDGDVRMQGEERRGEERRGMAG